MKRSLYILAVLLLVLCGCSPDLSGIDFGDADAPCDLSDQNLGERVKVGGLLEFVDTSVPDGWYADLERDDCRIGVWVAEADFKNWQPEDPETYREGAVVIAEGFLTLQPLPDRPEEFQLIIEVDQTLVQLEEVPDQEYEPDHDLPACVFEDLTTGEDVQSAGTILLMDDSAAAGVYLELDVGGCFQRLWVESRFYDEWSDTEKSRLEPGTKISLVGIYTIVRGEPTIDISEPPRLN